MVPYRLWDWHPPSLERNLHHEMGILFSGGPVLCDGFFEKVMGRGGGSFFDWGFVCFRFEPVYNSDPYQRNAELEIYPVHSPVDVLARHRCHSHTSSLFRFMD